MRANTDRRLSRLAFPRRGRSPTFKLWAEHLESRVVPAATAEQIAQALDLPEDATVGPVSPRYRSSMEVRTESSTGAVLGFPSGRDEDFLILSTGEAADVPNLGSDRLDRVGDYDGAATSFTLKVPPVPAGQKQYLKLDYRYITSEVPTIPGLDPFTITANNITETRSADNPGPGSMETFSCEVPSSGTILVGLGIIDADYGPDPHTDYQGLHDSAALIDNVRFETEQLVYLNFDGGPVSGQSIGLSAATAGLTPFLLVRPDRAALINQIVSDVAGRYSGLTISFVTARPSAGTWMEVFITGNPEEIPVVSNNPLYRNPRSLQEFFEASTEAGHTLQNVEGISNDPPDIGNRDLGGQVVIFANKILRRYTDLGESEDVALKRLATVAAHEIGHNLGLRHEKNVNTASIMKQNTPLAPIAIFENTLNDLTDGYYDHATQQNARAYLIGVLGLRASGSYPSIHLLDPGQQLRFDLSTLKGRVFDLTIGITGPGSLSSTDAGEEGLLPKLVAVPDGSSLVELTLPVVYQNPRIIFYGSSRPGGPIDVFSGAAVDGQLRYQDAFVPLFTAPGQFNAAIPVSYGLPGQLTRIGTAAVSPAVGDRPVVVEPPLLPPARPLPAYAVAAGAGGGPVVRVFNPDGSEASSLFAYDPSFGGGVRVALADVTGDGVPDVVTGPGPGGSALVRVFDGVGGREVASFLAFEESFAGGVFVAAADLDGDGKAEVIVSPDQGGGPIVAVYRGSKLAAGIGGQDAQLARFFGIQDPDFRGGARPALGDVNGDGTPDLVVSAGFLGGPRIAIFDGRDFTTGTADPRKLVGDFFAYESSLRNGAFVTAGDVDGDGVADLAFGGGPGGAPRVRLFDGKALVAAAPFTSLDDIPTAQVANFFAGDTVLRGGVRLALRDADGDGKADLVTGSGDGEPSHVRVYRAATLLAGGTAPDQDLDPFGATLANGVFVG